MFKRKRDPTFTNSEKMALLDLVERHFSIKKTDAISTKKKREEWELIAAEFNSMSSIHPRDPVVLKNCWENFKKKAKHENTLRNQHHLKTGGGPPKKIIEDPITTKVLELIQTRVAGYVNIYDSDGGNVLASSSVIPVVQNSDVDDNYSHATDHSYCNFVVTQIDEHTIDWSEFTPGMLRERRNAALFVPEHLEQNVQQQQEHLLDLQQPSTSAAPTPTLNLSSQEQPPATTATHTPTPRA